MSPRRVVAIVLPRLPSELVARRASSASGPSLRRPGPLAVVLEAEARAEPVVEAVGAASIDAVDDAAHARGIRPGQRVSEAMARVADLRIAHLPLRAVLDELAVVAEIAMGFGATVEIDGLDTVWVDVTGVSHLFGGEAAMLDEIVLRVSGVDAPRVLVAIADGPRIAQAVARLGVPAGASRIVAPSEGARALSSLPIAALFSSAPSNGTSSHGDLAGDALAFFGRLGVLTVADLARLDRAQLVARLESFLGTKARALTPRDVMSLIEGRDDRPLEPYVPPQILVDQMSFDEGVETSPQLLFALRGMVARLSGRLTGRGQATNHLALTIHYDRAIYLLRDDRAGAEEPMARLAVDLPAPLSHTDDLFRAVKAKVETFELVAPAVRIELALSRIARAPEVQLDLSRDVTVSPDALPALLSEISAEIGCDRVGVLTLGDDHRPERRSSLSGIHEASNGSAQRANKAKNGRTTAARRQLDLFGTASNESEPTRLLASPVSLGCAIGGAGRMPELRPGATVFVGRDAFVVEAIAFDRRLDPVAWWSSAPVARDYLRARLTTPASPTRASTSPLRRDAQPAAAADAWLFVERRTGEVFLQGWWE